MEKQTIEEKIKEQEKWIHENIGFQDGRYRDKDLTSDIHLPDEFKIRVPKVI